MGKCAIKQIMHDDIIEIDDLAESERTFSRFDLTKRLPIWKLLSTQEKDKLKEAYEKGGDRYVSKLTITNLHLYVNLVLNNLLLNC